VDYFQGVVAEFLRANRSTFVNTECLIQLDPGDAPLKGAHWYCDAVAVSLAEKHVYLCEVTYSTTLYSLLHRLSSWATNWPGVLTALRRDCGVPENWNVCPWVFIPRDREPILRRKVGTLVPVAQGTAMPTPKVTSLEDVVPWKYRSWDRKLEALADGAPLAAPNVP
jgi:hypothetical protein